MSSYILTSFVPRWTNASLATSVRPNPNAAYKPNNNTFLREIFSKSDCIFLRILGTNIPAIAIKAITITPSVISMVGVLIFVLSISSSILVARNDISAVKTITGLE